jgi:hypothetical protein
VIPALTSSKSLLNFFDKQINWLTTWFHFNSFLLTHLYSFFGALLGCSLYGKPTSDFPEYTGDASMYKVHKFMDLSAAEVGYFVTQVALAGASFGVSNDDLTGVGKALNSLFGMSCSPPAEVITGQGSQLQAICIDSTCPVATNAVCSQYDTAVEPVNATTTPTITSTTTSTSTSATVKSTTSTAGAASMGLSLMAVAGGFAALLV